MRIYSPDFVLSYRDKHLLQLLDRLLKEDLDESGLNSNSSEVIALSEEDAGELANRIDDLLTTKEFLNAAMLSETLSRGEFDRSRECYLSSRTHHGRTRVMSTRQYADFLSRLGFPYQSHLGVSRNEMSEEHFLRMERRLFLELGFSPTVVELAMRYVELCLSQVDEFREGELSLKEGFFRGAVAKLKHGLDYAIKHFPEGSYEGISFSPKLSDAYTREQLAGLLITVSNMSVIGVTRDWSAAGTMSTVAGGLTMLSK